MNTKQVLQALAFSAALLSGGHAYAQAPSCVLAPGTLSFSERSSELTPRVQAALDVLAGQMEGGQCRVVISGTSGGGRRNESGKAWSEEKSWERINNVVDYMATHHKIDRNRFVSRYKGTAGPAQLSFAAAGADDNGASREAEPHPELRKK